LERVHAVELELSWQGPEARHRARRVLPLDAHARARLPEPLAEAAAGATTAAAVRADFPPGALVPAHDPGAVHDLDPQAVAASVPRPLRTGRFYPRGLLAPVLGGDRRDTAPVRCLQADPDAVRVDANHPLAGVPLSLGLRAAEAAAPGAVPDPVRAVTDGGAGLQMRLPGQATDFGGAAGLARQDEHEDALFYTRPRLVHHLDARARQALAALYGRHLAPGMRVLDLMSSWTSHLPDGIRPLDVTGLGMNAEELRANPSLSAWLVQDLNQEPVLPFDDGGFDAVTCTVSVEYLTRPREVMAEAARVLRPGGVCMLTFSERWFPPKVVRIWLELHPFERLGLAADYLLEAGFRDLETESHHGLPRPADDPYGSQLAAADPLYAASGRAPEGG
jgi:SAM-dependent methyltransferase